VKTEGYSFFKLNLTFFKNPFLKTKGTYMKI
jgi:hypothetical protein